MPSNDWDRVHREDKYAIGRAFAEYMEHLRDRPPGAGSMDLSSPEEQALRREDARDAVRREREARLLRIETERRERRLRDLERLDREWSRRSRKRRR